MSVTQIKAGALHSLVLVSVALEENYNPWIKSNLENLNLYWNLLNNVKADTWKSHQFFIKIILSWFSQKSLLSVAALKFFFLSPVNTPTSFFYRVNKSLFPVSYLFSFYYLFFSSTIIF